MIAATFFFDVIEDEAPHRPEFDGPEIRACYGAGVVALGGRLIIIPKASDDKRAMRLAIDRAHLAEALARTPTIRSPT